MIAIEPSENSARCIRDPYHQPMAVMYVDLDHFTRICLDLPAEQVFALIGEFQRIVTNSVLGFKGEINSYQGDGVLIVFGYQTDHGDCASRALCCAYEILEQIEALNAEDLGSHEPISATIGLQYGQVWIGTIGISRSFGPTLIGDAVNVAVRLEQQAHGLGTTIVAGDQLIQRALQESRPAAADLGRFARIGPLWVRGRGTPLVVWTLRTENRPAAPGAAQRTNPACVATHDRRKGARGAGYRAGEHVRAGR